MHLNSRLLSDITRSSLYLDYIAVGFKKHRQSLEPKPLVYTNYKHALTQNTEYLMRL